MRRLQLRTAIGAALAGALVLGVLTTPGAAEDAPGDAPTSTTVPATPSTSVSSTSTTVPDPSYGSSTTTTVPSEGSVDPATLAPLQATAASDGDVRVIVRVADGENPTATVNEALEGTQHDIGSESDDIVGVEVDGEGLARLSTDPDVESIVEDVALYPLVDENTHASAVRADVVHLIGREGQGRRIAVLDSGVDLAHDTFGDIVVAEGCVVALGPDACGNVTGPGTGDPCPQAYSGCDHGTHVASLAVGRGSTNVPRGVAPAADLISIRVLSPNDSGQVQAAPSDIAAAIVA